MGSWGGQLDCSYFLNNIFFYRGRVNAFPGEKPPCTEEDIEDRDKVNKLMADMKAVPKSQEPRDQRRPLVKAIAQLSSDEDLTTITVAGHMDHYLSRGNLNYDNTRVREPHGGDIFVFNASKLQISSLWQLDDDGYPWSGKHPLTADGLKKRSFYYRPPAGDHFKSTGQHNFRKTIYYRPADHTCLIHYRGDHSTAEKKINRKTGKPKTDCKMLIQQRINEIDPQRTMGPSAVLDKLLDSGDGYQLGITQPKSKDQIRYYQRQMDQEKVIGGSEIINIGFLDKILGQQYVVNHSGHPHKIFFMAHNQSLANMKHLLKTMGDKKTPLLLHFDTTFKFGNYYLSPLVYRHPQIIQKDRKLSEVENPDAIIPLVHVLHENKSHESLNNFFFWFNTLMKQNCPKFLDWPKVLVSDREFKEEYMPNTRRVFCKWHLLKDLERYGIGLGMKKKVTKKNEHYGTKNVNYYVTSINNLMNAKALDDYYQQRDQIFNGDDVMWNSPEGRELAQYYMKNLEEDIIYRSGYWYLDSLGLGQFTNGLTNNASETYNSMIRHLKPKGNTRQTADITAIKLFSFECCLHSFVLACYFGRGEFPHCSILLVLLA